MSSSPKSGTSTQTKTPTSKKKQKIKNTPHKVIHQDSITNVTSALYGLIETKVLPSFEKDILFDRFQKEIIRKFHYTLRRPRKTNPKTNSKKNKNNEEEKQTSSSSIPTKKTLKRKLFEANKTPNTSDGDENESVGIDLYDEDDHYQEYLTVLKSRIITGTNQCTRALESMILRQQQNKKANDNAPTRESSQISTSSTRITPPSEPIILFIARDVRPPTILAHFPVLAKALNIPLLLLPGRASFELGQILGVKKVSVLLLMKNPSLDKKDENKSSLKTQNCHRCLDSFAEFAKTKVLEL